MVYRRNVEETYLLKIKASRAIMTEINNKYPIFPFALRSLDSKNARLGLKECLNHNLLIDYPTLYEKERMTLLLLMICRRSCRSLQVHRPRSSYLYRPYHR